MPDATPAIAFLMMLIAPCAIAVWGERKKRAKKSADAALTPKKRVELALPVVPEAKETAVPPQSGSVPVFTPPPVVTSARVVAAARTQGSRGYTEGPDPYASAASLYAQPASSYVETYREAPPVEDHSAAEALLAQAAAAKAKAAALAEAARAAQAKAQAAADVANRAARAAAMAHEAAQTERDIQAQITAQEQKRTASGEHVLPETHPSLDFPRSGRPRRAA